MVWRDKHALEVIERMGAGPLCTPQDWIERGGWVPASCGQGARKRPEVEPNERIDRYAQAVGRDTREVLAIRSVLAGLTVPNDFNPQSRWHWMRAAKLALRNDCVDLQPSTMEMKAIIAWKAALSSTEVL
jgi:hypothetical protein